ncbi:hypothetical protein B0H13DRAFT_2335682 [Mycena leptocephala]|nr:hypothetical protein B0H13DRAFT_2335682 [Mycena leptocephala]
MAAPTPVLTVPKNPAAAISKAGAKKIRTAWRRCKICTRRRKPRYYGHGPPAQSPLKHLMQLLPRVHASTLHCCARTTAMPRINRQRRNADAPAQASIMLRPPPPMNANTQTAPVRRERPGGAIRTPSLFSWPPPANEKAPARHEHRCAAPLAMRTPLRDPPRSAGGMQQG